MRAALIFILCMTGISIALIRAGAHAAEADTQTIRPMTPKERLRAAEKDRANDARPNQKS